MKPMEPVHKMPTLSVPVTATDHSAGPDHARVTVVEYGDFECPTCAAVEPAVKQLRELHQNDVRFVFRHFPLEEAHPHALIAAEAAEAAAGQGKFWPMHDLLLGHSRQLDRHHLDGYAAQIGLDMTRFKAEMDDEIYRQRVREHQEGGRRSHLRATPTFFVNGVVQDVSGGMQELFDVVAARVRT
jgi:protein-disulfide isomerase